MVTSVITSSAFLAILSYVVTETVMEVASSSISGVIYQLFRPLPTTLLNCFSGHSPTSGQHAQWSFLSPSICSCVYHWWLGYRSDIHPTRLRSTVLLGDFNINLMSATPHTNPCFLPMRDLAGKFNFTQVVTEPTRCTNVFSSMINHVYLSEASLLQSCLTLPPLGSSDHNCLLVKLNWSIPPPVKYKRTNHLVLPKSWLWLCFRGTWNPWLWHYPVWHQLSLVKLERLFP